jgi:hypothetical protein
MLIAYLFLKLEEILIVAHKKSMINSRLDGIVIEILGFS